METIFHILDILWNGFTGHWWIFLTTHLFNQVTATEFNPGLFYVLKISPMDSGKADIGRWSVIVRYCFFKREAL